MDIAKCNRHDCPNKETCYRYLASADKYQTYILIDKDDVSECDYYWECKSVSQQRRLDIQNGA